MPKTWKPSDAKRFCRELKLGQAYYYVNTHDTKRNPYEDSKTYSEVVFTGHLPFTNSPCTDGGYSAHTLCQNFGPMYDAPPRGLRNLDGPAPQVGAPLGNDYTGILDEAEIRGLDKRVLSGSDPHTRSGGKTQKRSRFSW
ncbi:hypothetical protein OHV08_34040 [Streptomyces canus]|uniref:hypothetical protein n=1 Tax=Streptomyces canus TaxID=58343 RepID=UPI003244755B